MSNVANKGAVSQSYDLQCGKSTCFSHIIYL